MEAAPDEGVGCHLPLADERVALQHFNAGGATQDGGEKGRMCRIGGAGKRRIQRKETRTRGMEGILLRD